MLRTIFVATIIVIGIAASFKGAFNILLFYLWIAYFRPDSWLHWDWVTPLWVSFSVGVSLVVTTIFSSERFRFGIGPVLLVAFLLVGLTSSVLSTAQLSTWRQWWETARILLVCYSIVVLVTSEQRLRLVMLVIAASLSFEGAKQGWLTLFRAPGMINTNFFEFLGDNNGVAIGMLMLVPILTGLSRTAPSKLERLIERFLIIGVIYRALTTYSRGGFIACGALAVHYLIRSKLRPTAIIGLAIVAGLLLPNLPQTFWDRMDTINQATNSTFDPDYVEGSGAQTDVSIVGRWHFWQVAQRMAFANPMFGIGLHAFNDVYDQYDFSGGQFGRRRSVHSSWFGMMAETGFLGFGIYVALFVVAFVAASRARRFAKQHPEYKSLGTYAYAIEGSLVVFAIGGAFITFQYNEFVWHLFAISMALSTVVAKARAEVQERTPVLAQSVVLAPPVPSRQFGLTS
jgi:putative inorganic carbon (HCO3(-)) transporter